MSVRSNSTTADYPVEDRNSKRWKTDSFRLSTARCSDLPFVETKETLFVSDDSKASSKLSAQAVSTMRQLLRAFTIAAIFAGAGATTTDLDLSKALPPDSALVDKPFIERSGNVSTESALQNASAKSGAGNPSSRTVQEERGWWVFSRFRPLKNLLTIKEEEIAKYSADEKILLRAFRYLASRNINPLQAYMRLGGPKVTGAKEEFAMRFSEWGGANSHLFKLSGTRER